MTKNDTPKGYYPEIGENDYNVRFLLRAEPDHELRRIAVGTDKRRAKAAAKVLAQRLSRRRQIEFDTASGDRCERAAAANRATYARRKYFAA